MGYLTTLTIYNDGCDQIEKYPKEFAEKVTQACCGSITRGNKSDSFGLGYHANLVTVQRPRHADDQTLFMHSGNTLIEMNPYSQETLDIAKRCPDWFAGMVKTIKGYVKELERIQKEMEK